MPLLLQFTITLLQVLITLTLLNCFGINHETNCTYTYTLDCFGIRSVIISARRVRPVIIKPVGRIFEISDSNMIRGNCGKCGRSLSTQKNNGLSRFQGAKTRKKRKTQLTGFNVTGQALGDPRNHLSRQACDKPRHKRTISDARLVRLQKFKNEKSAQRGSFWDGRPADIRG